MSHRGKWRGGRGGGHPVVKTDQLCRFFRSGRCTFGQRCKFSHDSSSSASPGRTQTPGRTQMPRRREPSDERVQRFKQLVSSRTYGSGISDQSLFSLGLEVLTSVKDASAQQEVVTLLASDNGLSCIRQVVESRIPRAAASGTTFAKRRLWETDMRPLFRMVTLENVVRSNILDVKVSTIYNFLAGVDGSRLPAWFDLAKGLAEAPDLPSSITSIEVAELCLAVLSKMIDCNASHLANPTFRNYAASFISIAARFDNVTPENKMCKIQATEYASLVSRRLEAGPPSTISSLKLRQDLPGTLSGDGPRHDNDHDDITKISILPTPDEIASDRSEYLPTADPALWHRSGIAGRLDREFRLLREDTVGQLRDVVRTELGNLQHESNQGWMGTKHNLHERGSTKNSNDTIRYCKYYDTSITELGFDRRTGPEFLFRFRQPAVKSGAASRRNGTDEPGDKEEQEKSLAQRRDWWLVRAKKRLQPGGLVCVIDSRGSTHFLTVADSTIRSVADTQSRQNGFNTTLWQPDKPDSGVPFTLADDPSWSFVRLKLPPGNDDDQDQLRHILTQLFFNEKVKKFARFRTGPREYEPSCILVEFPGILLDSFLHTLQALKSAAASLNVPFANLLAAECAEGGMTEIPPPKYAQKPGFLFDMSCLAQGGAEKHSLLYHDVCYPLSAKEVEKQTRLDTTQSAALIDALSRSVALIQGPPGTGKTYAGVEILKVLLQNRTKADMGPIMIVCYTNHALDQLLEHTLDARPATQVIRMGSRSKSERLKDMSLYEMSRAETRTRSERVTLAEEGESLEASITKLQTLSERLGRSTSFNSVAEFLQKEPESYFSQIFGYGGNNNSYMKDDGYETVQGSKDKAIIRWLRGGTQQKNIPAEAAESQETTEQILQRLQLIEETSSLDLSSLNANERSVLYREWQYRSFSRTARSIREQYVKYAKSKKEYDHARRETDLRCLQNAEIVGVTTTGLARNLDLLRNLRSKVLLCEEAGEVLEAHMLTSLIPSLEHVILIGDHQQLRPQVQNFDLRSDNPRGAQYSFDMSLFERLVSPVGEEEICLPFSQLFTQRRMHPSISDLIRAPLYPALQDGPNVLVYPEVPGIERRLFWLQHEQLEQGASSGDRQADPTSTSRTNLFEVDMTAALVSHLFKQGVYGPGDIAVLTPYLGQMMLLQRRMSSMFEISFNERDEADLETVSAVNAGITAQVDGAGGNGGNAAGKGRAAVPARTTLSNSVRIATVDNFQGEEAKVVVVSMVRSNEEKRCGFLSTSNRINVLLSRAKHGMYIIGNSETCSRVPMWQQVIGSLEEGGNIGRALPLQCPRHPERRFEASKPEHFMQFAPDGGCLEPCNKPLLPCQHTCKKPCHSDTIHAAVKCGEPCPRPLKGCSHPCPRKCSDTCVSLCKAVLTGRVLGLPCGHSIADPACWQTQSPGTIQCLVSVRRTVPGCGHVVSTSCSGDNVNDEGYKCKAACGAILPCGHACSRRCYECKSRSNGQVTKEDHGPCQSRCGVAHDKCKHACRTICHANEAGERTKCPPCTEPCTVQCSHSRCNRTCGEVCAPCAEKKCASHCPHSSCTRPCAAPCDWIPCSKRCEKQLSCGHQCPSLCGEPCPSKGFCQACAGPRILDQMIDLKTLGAYRDVDLNEDPCLFFSCGHVFSVSFMDGMMDLGSHYEMGGGTRGCPIGRKALPVPFCTDEAAIGCPCCRRPLRDVARYGRIVRQSLWDTSVKQFMTQSKEGFLLLVNRLAATMETLHANQQAQQAARSKPTSSRTKLMISAGRAPLITKLLNATSASRYGPLLELRNSISAYATRMRTEEQRYQKIAASDRTMHMGCHLQAKLLLLRCDALALFDMAHVLTLSAKAGTGMKEMAVALTEARLACFGKDCDAAIDEAQKTANCRQEADAKLIYASLGILFAWLLDLVRTRIGCMADKDASDEENRQKQQQIENLLATESQRLSGMDDEQPRYPLYKYSIGNRSIVPFRQQEISLITLRMRMRERTDEQELDTPLLRKFSKAYATETTAAYREMASDFHGLSGHWHTCANGHAFTTESDTAPAEEETQRVWCPECSAPAAGPEVSGDEVDGLDQDIGGLHIGG